MENRRKHKRIQRPLNVGFRLPKKKTSLTLQTQDISEGGMRLLFLEGLAPGTVLELSFKLPGQAEPIIANGEIVWQSRVDGDQEYSVGIRFVNLKAQDREKLRGFVAESLLAE